MASLPQPCESLSESFTSALAGIVEAHAYEICKLQDEIRRLRTDNTDQEGYDLVEDEPWSPQLSPTTEPGSPRLSPTTEETQEKIKSLGWSEQGAIDGPMRDGSMMSMTSLDESGTPQRRFHRSFTVEDEERRQMAKACSTKKFRPSWSQRQKLTKSFVATCVQSMWFEMFFAGVIATNSIYMGIQIEFDFTHGIDQPAILYVVRYAYTLAFTVELVMRMFASGLKFLHSHDRMWNWLDIVLVTFSWFEMVGEVYGLIVGKDTEMVSNVSHVRMLRIIRAARLARVLRIGRMFHVIRAFRILVFSIATTMKTVIWALLLLAIIIYVFSLALRQAAGEYLHKKYGGNVPSGSCSLGADSESQLQCFWGSLPRSMFTLFKSIAGGLSWHECAEPLLLLHPIWIIVFLIYICVTAMAVLNVITGVFCQSAIEGALNDRDLAIQKHLLQRKEYINTVRKLFKDIDSDNSNCITLEEFEAHFESEESLAFFAALEIDHDHAWEVFKLLDVANQGSISIEEFVVGCVRLHGSASALDVERLHRLLRRMDRHLVQCLELEEEAAMESRATRASMTQRPTNVSKLVSSLGFEPKGRQSLEQQVVWNSSGSNGNSVDAGHRKLQSVETGDRVCAEDERSTKPVIKLL